jgi:hypothetical protein
MTNPDPAGDLFASLDALAAALSAAGTPLTPEAPAAKPAPAGMGDDEYRDQSKALTPWLPYHVHGMTREFLPHQAAAFLFILAAIAKFGGALLGHDMGLGKTQVFLAAIADALHNARNDGAVDPYAIIAGPPVGKGGYWQDAAAAFPNLRIVHLQGRKVYTPEPADIYFISDDPLTMRAWLTAGADTKGNLHPSRFALGATMFVRDEIHRDKGGANAKPTARAKVTLAVTKALRAAGKPVIGVTGSLLLNRPVEAFLPLQMVGGPELVTTITPGANRPASFLWRYCGAETSRFGTSFSGCDLDKMHELHDYLRRTVYCRIEKSDLGDTLPWGSWLVRQLALMGALMRRYEELSEDFLGVVLREKGKLAAERAARAAMLTQMNALRIEAGMAKASAAVEYVADLVDQGRQVVVFYEHKVVFNRLLDGLVKRHIDCAVINGEVTGDRRQSEIADFQAGRAKVVLAQTAAAGIACTLTAAADAVWVQLPWSAGLMKQACDRILRADQISRDRAERGEGVEWHVLNACFPDGRPSIDQAMHTVLAQKCQVVDAVNAGREITMPEGTVQELVVQEWFAAEQAWQAGHRPKFTPAPERIARPRRPRTWAAETMGPLNPEPTPPCSECGSSRTPCAC